MSEYGHTPGGRGAPGLRRLAWLVTLLAVVMVVGAGGLGRAEEVRAEDNVTLSPPTGPAGTEVALTFPDSVGMGTSVRVVFGSQEVFKGFTEADMYCITDPCPAHPFVSFLVPSAAAPGVYNLSITWAQGTFFATFTVTGTGKVTLSPTAGPPGTTVTVTADAPLKNLRLLWDGGQEVFKGAPCGNPPSCTYWQATFKVPNDAKVAMHLIAAESEAWSGAKMLEFNVTPRPGCAGTNMTDFAGDADKKLAVILVHGWAGDSLGLKPISNTLGARPHFMLDWSGLASPLPDSGSGVANPGPRTDKAIEVGTCIGKLLGGYEKVHLIGHSLGAWVIDAVADELSKSSKSTMVHLTFIDAYVPWQFEDTGVLGDNAMFAEHFVSRCGGVKYFGGQTDRILTEAHNFDITSQAKCEEGWGKEHFPYSVDWYAGSSSNAGGPGISASWEFGRGPLGHTLYPEGNKVTCLTKDCVSTSEAGAAAAALPVQTVAGSVEKDGEVVRMTTASPVEAILTLPAGSYSAAVQVKVTLTSGQSGAIELQLGNGQVQILPIGSTGFDGWVTIDAGGTPSSNLRAKLTAEGGKATAELGQIRFEKLWVAPQPPNAGTGAELAPAESAAALPLTLAVAVALIGGGLTLLAVQRRRS